MFDTAYGNFMRKKYSKVVKKKKSGRQKNSSKGQLTGILTELPGNRNFFPSPDKFRSNWNYGRSVYVSGSI